MVAVVFIIPVFWMLVLGVLSWLEDLTLAPEERAAKITGLLDASDPETIERQVSEMLANVGRRSKRLIPSS